MTNRHTAQILLLGAALLAPSATQGNETNKWSLDVSLYGLAVGMSGDIGIGPVNADINAGFDKIWDNLEFGAMGKLRLGYDRWALTTDVLYMDYETGSGASFFKYDILNQGPQLRVTFHF